MTSTEIKDNLPWGVERVFPPSREQKGPVACRIVLCSPSEHKPEAERNAVALQHVLEIIVSESALDAKNEAPECVLERRALLRGGQNCKRAYSWISQEACQAGLLPFEASTDGVQLCFVDFASWTMDSLGSAQRPFSSRLCSVPRPSASSARFLVDGVFVPSSETEAEQEEREVKGQGRLPCPPEKEEHHAVFAYDVKDGKLASSQRLFIARDRVQIVAGDREGPVAIGDVSFAELADALQAEGRLPASLARVVWSFFRPLLSARLVEPTFQQLALADDDGALLTSFTPQPFAVKWQSTWPFNFFPRDARLLVPPTLDFVCVYVSASASYRRHVRHVTSLPTGPNYAQLSLFNLRTGRPVLNDEQYMLPGSGMTLQPPHEGAAYQDAFLHARPWFSEDGRSLFFVSLLPSLSPEATGSKTTITDVGGVQVASSPSLFAGPLEIKEAVRAQLGCVDCATGKISYEPLRAEAKVSLPNSYHSRRHLDAQGHELRRRPALSHNEMPAAAAEVLGLRVDNHAQWLPLGNAGPGEWFAGRFVLRRPTTRSLKPGCECPTYVCACKEQLVGTPLQLVDLHLRRAITVQNPHGLFVGERGDCEMFCVGHDLKATE